MSDLEDMFKDLEICCLHDPQWKPADMATVVRWWGDRETGGDTTSIIIARLHSGEWGLLTQSEDYTGHGCQCSSMAVREPTLHKLLTHLSDWELEYLIDGKDKRW